jgi:hypothetical protein
MHNAAGQLAPRHYTIPTLQPTTCNIKVPAYAQSNKKLELDTYYVAADICTETRADGETNLVLVEHNFASLLYCSSTKFNSFVQSCVSSTEDSLHRVIAPGAS